MLTNTERSLNKLFDIEVDENAQIDNEEEITTSLIVKEEMPLAEVDQSQDESDQEAFEIRNDAQEDFAVARDNLKRLLDSGEDLLDSAIRIAESTEDPKAISAANSILQGLANINKSLMDISQKRQDIVNKSRLKDMISAELDRNNKGVGEVNTNIQNVTNNVQFVGTSTELMELIKQTREGK